MINLDMTSPDFQKNLIKCCKDGFHVGRNCPVIENNILTLYASNTGEKCLSWKKNLDFIKLCLHNFIDTARSSGRRTSRKGIYLTFDKSCIDHMISYTEGKKYNFPVKNSDNEISGKFNITPVSNNTILLTVDHDVIDFGDSDSVEPVRGIGSYHTHPRATYIKFSVCLAYPSVDDYITFLYIYSEGWGFFHVLSSMEGLYIITLSRELLKLTLEEIKEDIHKYNKSIREHYGMDYPTCDIKSKTYSKKIPMKLRGKINKYIRVTNKKPYFNVRFIEWKNASKPIWIHGLKYN